MDTPESLSDDLFDNVATSNFDYAPRPFWPEGTINDLIKRDVVRRELDKANESYGDELVDFILNRAKKLFAITTTVDSRPCWLLKVMKFFQSHDFGDSSLSAEIANNGGSTINSTSLNKRLATLDPKLWRPAMRSKFCEAQWKALAPVFSTAKSNYDFGLNTILPFTEINRNIKSGAFSRVYKVSIHRDHFKDVDCLVSAFACSS
jgi:hypothetical protein